MRETIDMYHKLFKAQQKEKGKALESKGHFEA